MGHRPQTAERVYNRMPGVERRRPALELASQLALGLSARSSGSMASGAAALGEGSGLNSWAQQQPHYSSAASSQWTASRADGYSSEEEELALGDEEEEEHESPPNWIDACLRSSSTNSSSTRPSQLRAEQPSASTVANATATIGTVGAIPITTGGGATRRRRAPMRCKTPGCDGSGSTPATFAAARCAAVQGAISRPTLPHAP
jgi:hypothetical protein